MAIFAKMLYNVQIIQNCSTRNIMHISVYFFQIARQVTLGHWINGLNGEQYTMGIHLIYLWSHMSEVDIFSITLQVHSHSFKYEYFNLSNQYNAHFLNFWVAPDVYTAPSFGSDNIWLVGYKLGLLVAGIEPLWFHKGKASIFCQCLQSERWEKQISLLDVHRVRKFKGGICCGSHLAVTYRGELLYLRIIS